MSSCQCKSQKFKRRIRDFDGRTVIGFYVGEFRPQREWRKILAGKKAWPLGAFMSKRVPAFMNPPPGAVFVG